MKILFQKYNKIMKSNKKFMEKNEDYFKRSDSDYAVLINTHKFDRKVYMKHYYWMNVMTYNILDRVSSFIDDNISEILPIDEITNKDLSDQLDEINKLLLENRSDKTPDENKLPYFNDVEKFIGIRIGEKTFMTEQIPKKFNLKILKSKNDVDSDDSLLFENNNKKNRNDHISEYGTIPIGRNSFYITVKEEKDKYYQALCLIDKKPLNSGVYQYYNETNRFASEYSKTITYFTLHRIKLNVILYFKSSDDNSYGFFQCPSELVDVPITTFDDYKSQTHKSLKEVVEKYQNTIENKDLTFYSYSIYGIIDDIVMSLFVENKYPWIDKKYEKKIHRLIYFFMLYLNNLYSNIDDIKIKLKKYFENYNVEEAKLNFKTLNGSEVLSDNDILYKNILTYITELNHRVNSSDKDDYKKKMDVIKQIFLENLNLFNPEEIQDNHEAGVEYVPYLKKYLKYKEKYLSIKNKLS